MAVEVGVVAQVISVGANGDAEGGVGAAVQDVAMAVAAAARACMHAGLLRRDQAAMIIVRTGIYSVRKNVQGRAGWLLMQSLEAPRAT